MTWFEALFVLAAGVGAGTINAVVGSGTLLTFPALLAVGIPPVLANVSNTVGLAPGTAAGAIGYRRELEGQRGRIIRLMPAATPSAKSPAMNFGVMTSSMMRRVVASVSTPSRP